MNRFRSNCRRLVGLLMLLVISALGLSRAEEVGERWGTEEREREYYPIVNIPLPKDTVIEAGAFAVLPDGRIAVGTRHGEIFLIDGVDASKPTPSYHRFATGLDEIFGLTWKDNAFRVTQSCELTRVSDANNDGVADRFETISDAWGYANYHEYAFGSKLDADGNQFVALGLSESYYSHALNRGFIMKVAPDGKTTAFASGLRSPGGIGHDEHGALFYIESQGPWNCSCSLKAVSPNSFHGHPASFHWYPQSPELGPVPEQPKSGTRISTEKDRVKPLVPYAVVFPYIRMGRSITAFNVDRTQGKFGPFENQLFLGDYTQSILMRATTEQINGVWQGACYPFREGLSTGILNVEFTPGGNLLCGGTNRGWPVRGIKPYALERLEWSGKMPFEINRVTIEPDGFKVTFTKPVEPLTGRSPESYAISAFTHPYHQGYGGPEIEHHQPGVTAVALADDGLSAKISVEKLQRGFVYELDLPRLRSRDNEALLHRHAFYTVNEIPSVPASPATARRSDPTQHPVPESPQWLTYPGEKGPGAGKHIVLIAADQEYRSEYSMPMLARLLAKHHGFHTTVLFSLNKDHDVDPTQKIRWEDKIVTHNIPGLEHLEKCDLVIFFNRLLSLPPEQLKHIENYLDSGKPLIGIRTANHGFIEFDYRKDGKKINFGEDVLGGSFRNHHGRWQQDSTRGIIVEQNKAHPILKGVKNIWGPSDVYRTYKEGGTLPDGCLPLVDGQPLMGRKPDDAVNDKLIPLPVAWVKTWTGNTGKTARVFHVTMGSAQDFQSDGLRRLTVNAAYWCLHQEADIHETSTMDLVGDYNPPDSGFAYQKLGIVPRKPSFYR
ncbi:MAG: ThuA domain-containing protein [Planctomycetaceae bacterium]|nr:ThuA domain-containing protein [Planctomycetaceae bacterium]